MVSAFLQDLYCGSLVRPLLGGSPSESYPEVDSGEFWHQFSDLGGRGGNHCLRSFLQVHVCVYLQTCT